MSAAPDALPDVVPEASPDGALAAMPIANHLVLVGLMGVGKTTVGELCAQRLRRPFVDTDLVVVSQTGRSISEIFATGGETEFRALEHDAVADACAAPQPCVIACGGGAVLDASNRTALRDCGFVVWLRASPETAAGRVRRDEPRPLLTSGDAEVTLRRLMKLREPAYLASAHTTVDTDGCDPHAIAEVVLDLYRVAAASEPTHNREAVRRGG